MVQRAVRSYGCVAIPSMTVQISALHPARAAPAPPTSRSFSLAPIVRPPGYSPGLSRVSFFIGQQFLKDLHTDILLPWICICLWWYYLIFYVFLHITLANWRDKLGGQDCVLFHLCISFPLPCQHLTEGQAGRASKPCDCYVRWSLYVRQVFFF